MGVDYVLYRLLVILFGGFQNVVMRNVAGLQLSTETRILWQNAYPAVYPLRPDLGLEPSYAGSFEAIYFQSKFSILAIWSC